MTDVGHMSHVFEAKTIPQFLTIEEEANQFQRIRGGKNVRCFCVVIFGTDHNFGTVLSGCSFTLFQFDQMSDA